MCIYKSDSKKEAFKKEIVYLIIVLRVVLLKIGLVEEVKTRISDYLID